MTQDFDKAKNAYLVLAHEDVEMLNFLVARLVNTGDVFIHLDQKCRISPKEVISLPGVHLFQIYNVKWGGWSIVEATLFLADKAIQSGAQRLTLLSGVSYPIVNDERLISLAKSSLDVFDAQEVNLETIDRHFKNRFTKKHFEFKIQNQTLARIIRKFSRELCKYLPSINPPEYLGSMKLMLGSQWWSATLDTFQKTLALMESDPRIKKYFSTIEVSDETIFNTMFKHASDSFNITSTTYCKWGRNGRPEFLSHLSNDVTEPFYFARKFKYPNVMTVLSNFK